MGQITKQITTTKTRPAPETKSAPGEVESAPTQGVTVYDLMLLGIVTIWAMNPAAIKWALDYIDPLAFNAIRFTLATLVLVVLLLVSREPLRWRRGDGFKLFALGVGGHGFYQAVFILGLNMTLAGNTALILSTSPVWVAIFGALLGYERVRAYTWAGVGISLAGVALVILGSGEELSLGSRLLGDLLVVAVTMVWALYTVLSAPLLTRYSPVKLSALTMSVGTLVLLLISTPALAKSAPTWPEVPALAWLILVLSGLLAVAIAYVVWAKGIQKLGAVRTAIYSNLVPVLAAAVSFFVLKEPLGWSFWAGMVLVITGVSLARFGGRIIKVRNRLRDA
jgi:drug/metabolite transporter (DMT)-like permease